MPLSDTTADNCTACLAAIRWAITVNGKRQPINADPDPQGNLAAYTDGTGTLRVRVLTAERDRLEGAEWQAMPHAATRPLPRTCPTGPSVTPARRPGTANAAGAATTRTSTAPPSYRHCRASASPTPCTALHAARPTSHDHRPAGRHLRPVRQTPAFGGFTPPRHRPALLAQAHRLPHPARRRTAPAHPRRHLTPTST